MRNSREFKTCCHSAVYSAVKLGPYTLSPCPIRAAKGGAFSETKPRLDHPTQPGLPRTDLILELAALPPGAYPSWHPGMAGHPESSLEVSLLSPGVGPSVGTALELGILATHFSGQESQEQVPRWRMVEGAGSSGVSEGLDGKSEGLVELLRVISSLNRVIL